MPLRHEDTEPHKGKDTLVYSFVPLGVFVSLCQIPKFFSSLIELLAQRRSVCCRNESESDRNMRRIPVWILAVVLCASFAGVIVMAQTSKAPAVSQVRWQDVLRQTSEWYASDEAVRIANNVLAFQRDEGGWPKNLDMAKALTERDTADLVRQRQNDDSTIDNGATWTQLTLLARVFSGKKLQSHKDAFLKGVDYLLNAQYQNGGWPQYYPRLTGYYRHITFNDGAMIGVLGVLRDIADRKPEYAFVDELRRNRSERAVLKGIECVLKTQIVVQGSRNVWCQQYDEVTLAPAAARTYELVSLASAESAGIVRFLIGLPKPNREVIAAVESAVAWFETSRIDGIRWVEKRDPALEGGFDRVVLKDANAGPLWARFYEIGPNRPIFVGRDGIIRYNVAEIEAERRRGYQWYVSTPATLIAEDYPAWRRKLPR